MDEILQVLRKGVKEKPEHDSRPGDLEGMVSELYDVAVLPGVAWPMALGFKTGEIQNLLSIGPEGAL